MSVTPQLIDINQQGISIGYQLHSFVTVGDAMYFSGTVGEHSGLWRTTEESQGAQLFKQFADRNHASHPFDVDGTLYFISENKQLWKSDGTEAGTVLVKQFAGDPRFEINPPQFTNVNGTVFFIAYDNQLWKTDGTDAGTRRVRTMLNPGSLTNVNGTLYFTHGSGELWTSDGTTSGTRRLKDGLDRIGGLTAVGSRLFFTANDFVHGTELWTSDGTVAGTTLVKDIGGTVFGFNLDSDPTGLHELGGKLVFAANDNTAGRLWSSDGTEAGTVVIEDISTIGGTANAFEPTLFDGELFFTVAGFGLEAGLYGKPMGPQPVRIESAATSLA